LGVLSSFSFSFRIEKKTEKEAKRKRKDKGGLLLGWIFLLCTIQQTLSDFRYSFGTFL